MVVYILDMVGYREGAFTAAWFVMAAANLTMLLSGSAITDETPLVLTVLLVLLYAVTLVLTGLWATLQFKWIHIQVGLGGRGEGKSGVCVDSVCVCVC